MFKSLCLSGGGIMGFIHLGVLNCLETRNLTKHINTVVATSIGAVVGVLFCIGLKSSVILEKMTKINHEIMQFSNVEQFFTTYGMDTGEYFMAQLVDIFLEQKVYPLITLQELNKLTGIRLIITGTNLSKHQTTYFTPETYPDMRVLEAVRISISVPFLLTAVIRDQDVYVDGGIKDNYPLKYCLQDFKSRNPTLIHTQYHVIGSYIESMNPIQIFNIEDYIYAILACCLKTDFDADDGHLMCTIYTQVSNFNSMDFNVNEIARHTLFVKGITAAQSYLKRLFASGIQASSNSTKTSVCQLQRSTKLRSKSV
jgi:predicted acylesterase/phospholipase RssA